MACCCAPFLLTGRPNKATKQTGTTFNLPTVTCVAATETTCERLLQLQLARDNEGISKMVRERDVVIVDKGTLVRVLNRGFRRSEIRIIDNSFPSHPSGWVNNYEID